MYREIREKYGLCYGFYINTDPYFNSTIMQNCSNVSMITASTEKQNVGKFCKIFESVMSEVAQGDLILDSDIKRVKNIYESKEIKAEDIASYNHYAYKNSHHCLSLPKKKKEILKMSVSEIREKIKDMLKDSKFNVSMLGKLDICKK